MKKQIIIACLILTAGLVLAGAGCEVQNADQDNAENQNNEQPQAERNQNTDETNGGVDPGVTKEDLENFKIDLEGTSYDDLNALTK